MEVLATLATGEVKKISCVSEIKLICALAPIIFVMVRLTVRRPPAYTQQMLAPQQADLTTVKIISFLYFDKHCHDERASQKKE